MSGKTIELEFYGYWVGDGKSNIPKTSGIYCVYVGTYDESKDTCTLLKIIYIGESCNVNTRIASHNKLGSWNNKRGQGEVLIYSFAPVPTGEQDRQRAEATLINHCYKNLKLINSEFATEYDSQDKFPFPTTTVKTTGKNYLLPSECTVVKM